MTISTMKQIEICRVYDIEVSYKYLPTTTKKEFKKRNDPKKIHV